MSLFSAEEDEIDSPVEQTDAELVDALRLALVSGVGPKLRKALLSRFDSASAVLSAAISDLRAVPGIGPKLAASIAQARETVDAEGELEFCRRADVEILLQQSPRYPRVLKEIHDPPGVLFVRGDIKPQDAVGIAIVGSRHATHYGLTQAERFGASLARAGVTVISGLARGVDGAAHRGAISAGGRTLAVLGSGVSNIYPPEHDELAEQVIRHGALISESPPRSAPMSGAFPQRNRLISGLSLGVLVVEASQRSGALITARHAMEQGRDVFAIPGRVDSRMSQGCHALIRDGAKLVQSVDDILEELGPLVEATSKEDGQPIHHPAELLLNEIEQQVLGAIRSDATSIDEVITASALPPQNVLATLSILEMRRLVKRLGSRVMRA